MKLYYFNKKILAVFIATPIIFFILMTLTQLIPNSWVDSNVEKSRDIIKAESFYHDAYHVPQTHWLAGSDGYSDDIFLQQQIADRSHSIFYGAMMPNYDRYWHGYSIFLRPLLVFFDLSYIRQVLVLCFVLLLIILVVLISRHINLGVAIFLGIALALVNPPVIMISLQYSNMFLLMLSVSIVLMLLLAYRRPKHEIFLFFALTGCLTSFFDLLTTPSITLGIPLLLYIAFRIKHKDQKNLFKDVLLSIVLWGTGYFIAWFSKWLIGSLILHRNIFVDATQKILFWSADSSSITNTLENTASLSIFTVLGDWINRLVLYWPVLIVAIIGLGGAILNRSRSRKSSFKFYTLTLLALLMVTVIPVAWIVLARQHSFNHQWFSYRHLIILLFGVSLIIWYIGASKVNINFKAAGLKIQVLTKRIAATLFGKT